MYVYLFPVFILVNEINRQITTSEIYLLKGDTSLSGEMEIVFTELLLFWRMKTAMKNMWKSLDQLKVCWKKNLKVLSWHFPPRTSWRILSGKAISRELRQKLWTYIQMCIAPFATHLYLMTYRRKRKGSVLNRLSTLVRSHWLQQKKQCRCLIP